MEEKCNINIPGFSKIMETRISNRTKWQNKYLGVTNHIFDRWNDRVGPLIHDSYFLRKLLIELKELGAFTKINNVFGMIDGDIIFTYKEVEHKIVITSLYGRKTLNPLLNRITSISNHRKRTNDGLGLSISKDVLMEQKLPFVPLSRTQIVVNNISYDIQNYSNISENLFFIIEEKSILKKARSGFKDIMVKKPIFLTEKNKIIKNLPEEVQYQLTNFLEKNIE